MVEDHDNRKVYAQINTAVPTIRNEMILALQEIGRENVRHLRRLIKDPPNTGRIYNRPGNMGRRHQASAPGEAPADQTGRLRKSVSYRVRGSKMFGGSLVMEFGETAPYGIFLERGTKQTSKTAEKRARRRGKYSIQFPGREWRGLGWRMLPRPHVSRTVVERDMKNFKILDSRVEGAVFR
jgi:hypothetical protein